MVSVGADTAAFDKFQEYVRKARESVQDMRVPFKAILNMWLRSNKAIFALKGPGKYTDLTPNYKKQKRKASPRGAGFVYPILKFSGDLAESITLESGTPYSIRTITKDSLVMGSSIPYGKFHQFGTKKMARRPFVLFGPEQTGDNKRLDAAKEILEKWAYSVLKKANR